MAQKTYTNQNDWQSHLLRLEGAYAPATIKAYYADVRSFVDWCGRRRLESFPARVETVCAFVEDQGGRLVPTTVRRRIGAIGKFHRLMGLPDPTRDEEVRISMRRIVRSRRLPPQQARGLSRDQLSEVLAVQPETGWGLRDRALLALGFEMLARRSEIVALRDGDIELRADGTLRVTIRRSKTDQAGMGRFVFTSRQTARFVAEWIEWRGAGFEFLFCPIYQGRAIRRELNAVTVRRAIQRGAVRAGLERADEYRGHSLRVGAAQELLCSGHDTVAIMRAGGWKSVATLARYLEHAEHNVWARRQGFDCKFVIDRGQCLGHAPKRERRFFLRSCGYSVPWLGFAWRGQVRYIAPRHMEAIRDTGNELVSAMDVNDSVGIIGCHFPEAQFFTDFKLFDAHVNADRRAGRGRDYVSIAFPTGPRVRTY